MNLIKAIFKAFVQIANDIYEFVAGPFEAVLTEKNDEVRAQVIFSVALRVLFFLGYAFGWTGVAISIATTLIQISFALTVLGMVTKVVEIIASALRGEEVKIDNFVCANS